MKYVQWLKNVLSVIEEVVFTTNARETRVCLSVQQ